jgi:hypothetical protein
MAEIHPFPTVRLARSIPAPGIGAGERVRCPQTGKTGTVFIVARTGIVSVDWDQACGGGRFARNPDRLERLAPEADPAVVVRLPGAGGARVLRRRPDTGSAHWLREAPTGAGA